MLFFLLIFYKWSWSRQFLSGTVVRIPIWIRPLPRDLTWVSSASLTFTGNVTVILWSFLGWHVDGQNGVQPTWPVKVSHDWHNVELLTLALRETTGRIKFKLLTALPLKFKSFWDNNLKSKWQIGRDNYVAFGPKTYDIRLKNWFVVHTLTYKFLDQRCYKIFWRLHD